MQVTLTWGTTAEERERSYACDGLLPEGGLVCWRGVDVAAPAPTVFRRLCQLRVAPYSYDWVDNLGRRSPRELIPGLEDLEVGQRFMTMFELVAFEPDRRITLLARSPVFGEVAATYEVVPVGDDRCRLLVKLRWRGRFLPRRLAAAGDLVMMRRQLLNLRDLAEEDHRRNVRSGAWHPPRTSLLPPPARH